MGMGWEWEIFLAYGNSHMWESYGKSSFPHVGILWEWDGNGNENFLPTATLISRNPHIILTGRKVFHSHGNPIDIAVTASMLLLHMWLLGSNNLLIKRTRELDMIY